MASSIEDSAWQEVVASPCNVCEKEDDVNNFCRECHQYLCDGCKQQHSRITYCMNHTIVSKSEGYKIDHVKKVICNDHNEPFAVFCRPCRRHICSKCLIEQHSDHHDFASIIDIAEDLNNKIKKIIQQKEDQAGYAILTLSEYIKSFNDGIAKCDQSILDLKHRVSGLISDVKLIEEAMIKRIAKRKSELIANEKMCQESLSAVIACRKKTADIERERQNQSYISIVGFMESAQDQMKRIIFPSLHICLVTTPIHFIPGKTSEEDLLHVIGDVTCQQYPLKELSAYDICSDMMDKAYLRSICSTDDACLCLSVTDFKQNLLVKIKHDRSIISVLKLSEFPPSVLQLGSSLSHSIHQVDKDNIVASFHNDTIKLLNLATNTETTIYSSSAKETLGDVVVTAKKDFLFAVEGKRDRPIIHRIDEQGNLIEEIDVGEGMEDKDVVSIQRLVLYKTDEYLLLMQNDKIYKMDSTYKISEPLIHAEKTGITRITSEKDGFIICCDKTGKMYTFNEDGEMLHIYEMMSIVDGNEISCLTVDQGNNLIVGTMNGDVFFYTLRNGIIAEKRTQTMIYE